jgi:hypothetical protein
MHMRIGKELKCSVIISTVIVLFLAVLVTPASALSYCDPLTSSYVHIDSGTGSFAGISSDNKEITVEAGSVINGSVTMRAMNGLKANIIAPMIATPSWGDPSTNYITVNDSITPCLSTVEASNISWQAPDEAGSYYIIFVFNAEYNASQVASCTNWRYYENHSNSVVWNDGNDIAALSTVQIAALQRCGRTTVDYRFESWWQEWTVPGDAITVQVTERIRPGTLSGRVLDIAGNPAVGVMVTLSTGESNLTIEDGTFFFELTDDCSYLVLSKSGYEEETINISVGSQDHIHLDDTIIVETPAEQQRWDVIDYPIPLIITLIAALAAILALRRVR